ncbi:MAG TPA: ABC transporter permease [Chloroflexota bacterium]|nr:ABC transporter permease [Chloroflexota bacterium]
MIGFVLARLAQAVPAVVGVTLVAFVLIQVSGDMTQLLLPADTTEEQRAAFRRVYGLDQPIPIQYGRYVLRLVQGDFGRSFVHGRPAIEVVFDRLPATIELTLVAMVIGVSLAIPAGVISAVRRDSIFDRLVTVLVMLGQSMPAFWLGMLLILMFAVNLQVLPVSGRGSLPQLVLPGLTLSMWPLTLAARLTRSGMLEVLSQDYIRTARAKGLGGLVVTTRHALRNALVPIVTVLGINLGGMLGGAVLTETVFAWPGIGTLVLASVLTRDYPVVLAALICVATAFVLINLMVDVVYGYLDPRIRTAHGR